MSLLPKSKNLVAWKGATFRKRLTLYTGATDATPPRDLTGYTATCNIVDGNDASLLSLTTSNGGVVLGGTAGTIDIVITSAQTAAATWTTGLYTLLITAPGPGDTDPLLYGTITINSH